LVSPGSSLSFGSKRIDFGRLGLCGNLTTYGQLSRSRARFTKWFFHS
jgi:hypothetical protein